MRLRFIVLFSLFLPTWGALAQVQISLPQSRIVLQRDANNQASVAIGGSFSVCVDKIEARAVPMQAGQGTLKDWTTLQTNPQGGAFLGTLPVSGGWYQIEVRGSLNGSVVGTASVQRVGVGEVFAIAGQSNAGGLSQPNISGATDDRVSCVNYFNANSSTTDPPTPVYSHLDAYNNLAMRGENAWSWGRLGDMLTSRLNVPVLFFNAGWGSTTSGNWRAGADDPNSLTTNIFTSQPFPAGQPYANLRMAFNYFIAQTGVRGLLWHQGENDAALARANNATITYITKDQYIQNLQTIIGKLRQQTGKNISWLVARVSLHNFDKTSQLVIDGQNQTIQTTANTFAGPNTDFIQNPRPDGDHFSDNGHALHAQGWDLALDNNFFANSIPYGALPTPITQVTCGTGNTLVLSLPTGYSSYLWSNGQTSPTITAGPGTYFAKVKDAVGNTIFSQTVTVPANPQPTPPTITADGTTTLCSGSSVNLLVSNLGTNCSFSWNNASTASTINVSAAGSYSVTVKNAYGCTATSTPVVVTNFATAPPASPMLSAASATTFCVGGTVQLSSSYGSNTLWSTGATAATVVANTSGSYTARAVDANGCSSAPSAPINVVVNPLPAKPVISANGPVSFCIGGQVTLTSNQTSNNSWSTGQTTQGLVITSSGKYTVRYTDNNGCTSPTADTLRVTVNSLPPAPIITPNGPTTYCQGNSITLSSSAAAAYVWSTGENTATIRTVNVGFYSLHIFDANGCKSPTSSPIYININPLPNAPTITASGVTTFCPDKTVALSSTPGLTYQWSNGQTTQGISVNQSGTYSARVSDATGCFSFPSNPIVVNVLPAPATPVILASGPTTFCLGGTVTLTSSAANAYSWTNGTTNQSISTTTSGVFALKVSDQNGCVSGQSVNVSVRVNALPSKPVITPESATTFCLGGNVVLSAPLSASYQWSTGATSQKITVANTGRFAVKIQDINGCGSAASDSLSVAVNPLPIKPVISAGSSTTFCADQNVVLTSTNENGFKWSNGETSRSVSINTAGSFTVQTFNTFGCASVLSDPVRTSVNPLPAAPIISADGPLSFCEGGSVKLCAGATSNNLTWRPTGETSPCITVNKANEYYTTVTDRNGCTSSKSNLLVVSTKILPTKPNIAKVGAYTLEAQGAVVGQEYTWNVDGTPLAFKTAIIKAQKVGSYQVRTRLDYKEGTTTLTCFSNPSEVFVFEYGLSDKGVEVYPNPNSTGIFTIETKDDLTDATVEVYSMLGHLLYETNVSIFNERKTIDLSNLPSSNQYIIKVSKNGFKVARRVIMAD